MRIRDAGRKGTVARVATGIGGAAGVMLIAAACSSGSSTAAAPAASASAGQASSAASAPASGAASGGTVIKTASSSAGTFLTDGSGRAVYLWVADTGDASTCSGGCASAWPPVTVSGAVTAAGAAKSADLGTITRSDGTKQVTYDKHPLYYFEGDSGPGTATGQGSDSFGAKWWLVTPAGSDITASVSSFSAGSSGGASAAATPASSPASAGGGY
jgi:predicted lipoprotein with Yx(FWY)xxD motif